MLSNRRHIRQIVSPSMFVALEGSSTGGLLYDICEGGMALDIVGPDLRAHRVTVDLDLPELRQHFSATGRVIWQNNAAKRVGLEFVDLPSSSLGLIKAWLSVKGVPGQVFNNSSMPVMPVSYRPKHESAVSSDSVVHGRVPFSEELVTTTPAGSPVSLANGSTAKESGFSFTEATSSLDSPSRNTPTVLEDFLNRQSLGVWILAAISIFSAIIVLSVGMWVYTSGQQQAGLSFGDLKEAVTRLFSSSSSTASPAAMHTSKIDPVRPHSSESKSRVNKPVTNREEGGNKKLGTGSGAPNTRSQFEVLDGQHGRRLVPRGGASYGLGLPQSAPNNESGTVSPALGELGQAGPADSGTLRRGYVSRGSSGEDPKVQIMPEYPIQALQRGEEGEVKVKVLVAKDGSVRTAQIISRPSFLDSTVPEAIRKWRYEPHVENGAAVEFETEIILVFRTKPQTAK